MAALRLAAALLATVTLSACFEISQEVWVQPDLSGRVRWEIRVSDQLAGTAKEGKATPLGSLPDAFQQARRDLEALPYVRSCQFKVLREGNHERYVLDMTVTDFRALDPAFGAAFQGTGFMSTSAMQTGGGNPYGELRLEERRSGSIALIQTLTMDEDLSPAGELGQAISADTGSGLVGSLLGQALGRAMTESVFLDRYCTVTFHAPNIVSTNGELSDGKTTAQWKLPIADLVRGKPDTRELRVVFRLGTPWWMWVPVIGLGGIALGAGALTVVVVAKSRPAAPHPATVTVKCTKCGAQGQVPAAKAGAHLRCKHCGAAVDAPDLPHAAPVSASDRRAALRIGMVSVVSGLAAAGIAIFLTQPGQAPPSPQPIPAATGTFESEPAPAATPAKPAAPASDTTDLRARLDAYQRGDYDSTWEDVRAAAKAGESNAQFVLSMMYFDGRGAPSNVTEGKRWLRAAAATGVDTVLALANEGHAGAQYLLGGMYTGGYAVTASASQAAESFRAAADQGHAGAQFLLAGLYGAGRGVPEDAAEALRWMRAAADQDHESAKRELAKLTAQREAEDAARYEREAQAREQEETEEIKSELHELMAQLTDDAVADFERFCDEHLNRLKGSAEPPDDVARRVEMLENDRVRYVGQFHTREAQMFEKLNAAADLEEMSGLLALHKLRLTNMQQAYRELVDFGQFKPFGKFTPFGKMTPDEDEEAVEEEAYEDDDAY